MKFQIVGADRQTGEDVEIIVEANDEVAAESLASRRNIMVSRVSLVRLTEPSSAMRATPAPPLEWGQVPNVPSVNVHLPRRGSSLGIAACILGSLAFLICWVPLIGLAGVPLSALGLILGIIGLLVAVFRKGAGIGFAIAGSGICGLALFVAFGSTVATGKALEASAKSMQASLNRELTTNQQVIPGAGPKPANRSPQPTRRQAKEAEPAPARDKAAESEEQLSSATDSALQNAAPPQPQGRLTQKPRAVPPTDKAAEPEEQWASAMDTVKQGDVTVRITSAKLGKVPLKSGFGDSESESADALLAIEVFITNTGANKKVEYHTFMGRGFSIGRDYASLRDNFDNTYKRINFGISKPIGSNESESIYPNKSITDVLVFELPIDTAEYLNLELPAQSFGGTGLLRFRIPAKMIQR